MDDAQVVPVSAARTLDVNSASLLNRGLAQRGETCNLMIDDRLMRVTAPFFARAAQIGNNPRMSSKDRVAMFIALPLGHRTMEDTAAKEGIAVSIGGTGDSVRLGISAVCSKVGISAAALYIYNESWNSSRESAPTGSISNSDLSVRSVIVRLQA